MSSQQLPCYAHLDDYAQLTMKLFPKQFLSTQTSPQLLLNLPLRKDKSNGSKNLRKVRVTGIPPITVISTGTDAETHATANSDDNNSDDQTHSSSHPCAPSVSLETHPEQLISDDATHGDGALKTASNSSLSQNPNCIPALNPDAVPFLAS